MADVFTSEKRSLVMSGIKGKNTRPELIIRKGLHNLGFRYRLHDKLLPGKPDIIFPKYKAVIFVNGCFWHGHDCHLFRLPSSNVEFWAAKINRNREIDSQNLEKLFHSEWRTAVIWECALKGKTRKPLNNLLEICTKWLRSDDKTLTLKGLV